jgi:hypothetical protein
MCTGATRGTGACPVRHAGGHCATHEEVATGRLARNYVQNRAPTPLSPSSSLSFFLFLSSTCGGSIGDLGVLSPI